MSTRKIRLQGKIAMRRQDYEANPPGCKTCIRRQPHLLGQPQYCMLGQFPVSSNGICNHWENKKGETLG